MGTIPIQKNKLLWVIAIFMFVAASGMAVQMRGALLPTFEKVFSISKGYLGLVSTAGSLSFTISVFFVGMSAGKIDIEKYLLVGGIFICIFSFFVGFSISFFMLLGFLIGRGFANGILGALGRPILSHLFSERRGWIFNLHTLAWAAGALIGPVYINLSLDFLDWRFSYLFLAVIFIPIIILIHNLEFPKASIREKPLSFVNLKDILRKPTIFYLILILFFCGGVEGGFFTWLPYYMNQFFMRNTANLALSTYLLAYIPGRYIYGNISEKIKYIKLIFINSLTASGLLFLTFFWMSGVALFASIFAAGFLISAIFPTTTAMGTDEFPEYSGPINAIALSTLYIGISTFPAVMGILASKFSVNIAMQSLVILMVGISVISMLSNWT